MKNFTVATVQYNCSEPDQKLNTIMLADNMSEGIFIAEFDLDKIRKYRNKEMMGNTFRKVKAYKELISEKVEEPFIRE